MSEPLGLVVVRRVGFMKAGRALGLLAAWVMYVNSHGEDPTLRELQGDTARSHASYSRDLQKFRAAFPGEVDPGRLARVILAMPGTAGVKFDERTIAALVVPEAA